MKASERLAGLAKEAEALAVSLAHILEPWGIGSSRRRLVSCCQSCGLYAVVSTAPDEPKFVGSTLKVRCRGRGTAPAWSRERSTALASALIVTLASVA
jgi:hypothetical protein